MKPWSHIRKTMAWVFVATSVCIAQQARTIDGNSVYCANDSGKTLCTDDGGKTWHDSEYFEKKPMHSKGSGAPPPVSEPAYRKLIPPIHFGDHNDKQQSLPIDAPVPGAAADIQEIVAAVIINGRPGDEFAHFAKNGRGHLYTTPDIFSKARVKQPVSPSFHLNGRDYYSLNSIPGLTYTFDAQKQTVLITVDAGQLLENVLAFHREPRLPPAVPVPGMFFNHDIEFSHAQGRSVGSGLLETGFFSGAGVLTSRLVSRDFGDSSKFERLDTQFIKDFPARRTTLTIGDATSSTNIWGRQVYYAGVRWASKFATDPEFVPYALPSLRGQAAQPSTIDLYVNNIRTMSQPVDAGPFSIPTIPVMTGQGNIQLVVTDVLGHQQVIDASYINATQLLRKGVSDYTYEAGTLRRGFGLTSDQYNSVFAEGNHRYGVTDNLTINGRGEVLPTNQTIGFGSDYALLPFGLVSSGFAVSHSDAGGGGLAYLQFQHRARAFGYSARAQITSSTFRQLGLIPGERPSRIIAQAQISRAVRNYGSISIGYLHKEDRMFVGNIQAFPYIPTFNALTPSVSIRVGRRAFLSATYNYAPSVPNGNSAVMALVIPLGARRSITGAGTVQNSGSTTSTEYTQQLPVGTGYGYRVRNTTDTATRVDAGFSYQNEHGTYDVEAAQAQGQTSFRLTERSSVLWMQNEWGTSRWLNDSFGVIEAPGVKDVRIYANNQYVTKTNGRGFAIVPTLVPYDRNVIRLDDTGVPLDLQMDLGERTVAPMPRSGVLLRFKAAQIGGALIQLQTTDGTAVPLGAQVRVNGADTPYQVAFRGEVFVDDISFPANLRVSWDDHVCFANISVKPSNEPLPKIGPVVCEVK
jgi:outer membrane usher protein